MRQGTDQGRTSQERGPIEVQKQRILRLRPMMFSSKMNLPFYSIQEVNETNGRVIKGSQSVSGKANFGRSTLPFKKTSFFFGVRESDLC